MTSEEIYKRRVQLLEVLEEKLHKGYDVSDLYDVGRLIEVIRELLFDIEQANHIHCQTCLHGCDCDICKNDK